jgi:predicted small lipoprotein YifL
VKRLFVVLATAISVAACGSGAPLKSAQSNKNVKQAETKVEKQVSKCMPRANGVPDPLLLRHHANLTKFEACTGVAKSARSFGKCAFTVVLGGLPTVSRLEKGLVACVEQNA